MSNQIVVYTAAVEVLKSIRSFKKFIEVNIKKMYELDKDMPYVPHWYWQIVEQYEMKKVSPCDAEVL